MDIREIKINKDRYIFVNESKGTYNGFKHISKLFKNNYLLNESKVNYINRTWEYYTFQTSMKKCIYELIELKKEDLRARFKQDKNINKITKKYDKELNKYFKSDLQLKRYYKIYKKLDSRC